MLVYKVYDTLGNVYDHDVGLLCGSTVIPHGNAMPHKIKILGFQNYKGRGGATC